MLVNNRLQSFYVRCLWSLPSLRDLELDFLTFLQRMKTLAVNCRVVHENVRAAFDLNKAKSLAVVKPLYGTFSHAGLLPFFLVLTQP